MFDWVKKIPLQFKPTVKHFLILLGYLLMQKKKNLDIKHHVNLLQDPITVFPSEIR